MPRRVGRTGKEKAMSPKMIVGVAVCLFAAACGSDPGDPGGAGCDFDTIDGTFLAHFDKVSGTCAEIGDVVTTTLVGGDPSLDCTTTKDAPSENGCRHDIDVTCAVTGGTVRVVGYVRQRDESASHFDGLATYYVTADSGGSCTGTYDVTYTRQ